MARAARTASLLTMTATSPPTPHPVQPLFAEAVAVIKGDAHSSNYDNTRDMVEAERQG